MELIREDMAPAMADSGKACTESDRDDASAERSDRIDVDRADHNDSPALSDPGRMRANALNLAGVENENNSSSCTTATMGEVTADAP